MRQSRILTVEPDVLIGTPLAEYLRECGYQVLEASNTSEAEELLNHQEQPVDVILADVGKGEDGGFALARWIRDNFPAVRLLLAGTISASIKKAGDLCHDGPALSKPYDHSLVRDRIQRLLARTKSNNRPDSLVRRSNPSTKPTSLVRLHLSHPRRRFGPQ